MITVFRKSLKFIPFIVFIAILVSFFTYLFKNQNHYAVPNTDIFQYINDGRQYLSFKLPPDIHPAPAGPILICLVSKIFEGHVEYPEITAAHIINITAATLILLNIFLLLYRYSPLLSLSVVFLLATNRLFQIHSLNVTTEIVYGFFLTLVLLLYQSKHRRFAYILSGFLFFFRYESIVLTLSIFIVEFIFQKDRFKIRNVILAFIPIIFWLIVLNGHSYGSSIMQNAYLKEMSQSSERLPNQRSVNEMVNLITFTRLENIISSVSDPVKSPIIYKYVINLFPAIILILFTYSFFISKNPLTIKIAYLTLIFQTLFLALFPNYNNRYQVSVIWILYLLLISRNSKLIRITLILALAAFNIYNHNRPTIFDNPNEKMEYRLVADWLNQQKFQDPTVVFIYDPGILNYFIHDKNVLLDFNSYEDTSNVFTKCQNDLNCVVEKKYKKYPNLKYIFVSSTLSTISKEMIFDPYTQDIRHHITAFHDDLAQNSKFKFLTKVEKSGRWANIYQFTPNESPAH